MKNPILFIIVCIILFISPKINCGNLYYYGCEEKIPLSIVHNKRAILHPAMAEMDDYIERIGARIQIIEVEPNWLENPKRIHETEEGKLNLPIFLLENELEMILLPEIILKPKSSSFDMSFLSNKYNLTLKNDNGRYQTYSVPISEDIMSIGNELYETGLFHYAYPNFFCTAEPAAFIPNDTYFPYQIACHNIGQTLPNGHSGTFDADINAPEAWDITKGSSDIIVAVIDQGVTSNHPDLPNSRQIRLNGSNFGTGNPNSPSPIGNDNHGNACAGVIAATMNNNQGIAGIASKCNIMPIRMDSTTSPNERADAIDFAVNHGANIISCSWNYRSNYPFYIPVIVEAIDSAIHRNVIVVFSAGNSANHVAGIRGDVLFPACAMVQNLIAVGASDRYDKMANYSPSKPGVSFVAPSHRAYRHRISTETKEMWTIDIPGNSGDNPIPEGFNDSLLQQGTEIPDFGTNYLAYTGCFGGTSHSCPVVAGVVALMLSINPYLTPADVYDILRVTSAKVGGYTYTNGRCNEMGYGRVDAYAAVLEAHDRHPIHGSYYYCVNDTTCFSLPDIPTGATCTWTAQVSTYEQGWFTIIDGQGTPNVCIKHSLPTPINLHERSESDRSINEMMDYPYSYVRVIVNNGATSDTIQRVLRMSKGDTPAVSASDNANFWMVGYQRTFTVTNCTDEPDSVFVWTTRKGTTIKDIHVGKTYSYTPTSTGAYTISVTNTEKECGKETTTLPYRVIRLILPNAYVNGTMLHITIAAENDESTNVRYELTDEIDYTLELCHSIYGCMRTKQVHSTHEQIDISGLPQGTYALILKANNDILAQTKVLIK